MRATIKVVTVILEGGHNVWIRSTRTHRHRHRFSNTLAYGLAFNSIHTITIAKRATIPSLPKQVARLEPNKSGGHRFDCRSEYVQTSWIIFTLHRYLLDFSSN